MKNISLRTVVLFLVAAPYLLYAGAPARADIEWTVLKQLNLDASPLDVVTSTDGKWMFVLVPGEVVVYAMPGYRVADRLPADKTVDRLGYSATDQALILTSTAGKTLKFVHLDVVHQFFLTGLPYKGPENAPVTIAVFSDYQWPYCARLEPFLQQVLDKYPKDVKVVMKNFPLPMHPFARKAAAAALAADRQGKYHEFSHKLFENTSALNDAKIQEIAKQLGLDPAKFSRDISDQSIQNIIDRDLNEGGQAEVQGTPTVFINGRVVKNLGTEAVQAMIERELRKKRK